MARRWILAIAPALTLGVLFFACGTDPEGATSDASMDARETSGETSGETTVLVDSGGGGEASTEDASDGGFVFFDAGGGWCYREAGTDKPFTCAPGNACRVVLGEPGWWLYCTSPDADIAPVEPCGRILCGKGCHCAVPEASICGCS